MIRRLRAALSPKPPAPPKPFHVEELVCRPVRNPPCYNMAAHKVPR